MIARLRPKIAQVTGISLFLNPVQDLRMGGRQSNSTYQYTLKSDNRADLKEWAGRLADAMKRQMLFFRLDAVAVADVAQDRPVHAAALPRQPRPARALAAVAGAWTEF